jgi:hypothetical protein
MVSATWLASVMLMVVPVAQAVAFARHQLQMVQALGFNHPAALQVMVPAWQLQMLRLAVVSQSCPGGSVEPLQHMPSGRAATTANSRRLSTSVGEQPCFDDVHTANDSAIIATEG